MKKLFPLSKSTFILLFFMVLSGFGFASEEKPAEEKEEGKFDPKEVILHHVVDDHQWHFSDHFVVPLPIIVYSSENGFDAFLSSRFYDENHRPVEYKGYKLEHHHIVLADSGKAVLDLSITKNVAMLLINSVLMLLIFISAGKSSVARVEEGKVPKGIQSFIEPIVLFVRDEIAKPNLGNKYQRYLPYLLTLFFFILFGNFLGLLPGAGNLTGNIAITLSLALLTFIITNFSGNKQYWSHIFWTPGVPTALRPIILPVEIIGLFTKPFSLTIRLFVAITAGHIVLLSLICLTFIFKSYVVGVGTSIVLIFINLIELLVAGIQAYVFTLFTSLYIGMATAEDHH